MKREHTGPRFTNIKAMDVELRWTDHHLLRRAIRVGTGAFKVVMMVEGAPIVLKLHMFSQDSQAECKVWDERNAGRHLMVRVFAGCGLQGDLNKEVTKATVPNSTTVWVTVCERLQILGDEELKKHFAKDFCQQSLKQHVLAILGMIETIWEFFVLGLIPWDAKPDNFGFCIRDGVERWVMIDLDPIVGPEYSPNKSRGAFFSKIIQTFTNSYTSLRIAGHDRAAWTNAQRVIVDVLNKQYRAHGTVHAMSRRDRLHRG